MIIGRKKRIVGNRSEASPHVALLTSTLDI